MDEKTRKLNALKKTIESCGLCGLASQCTQKVYGEGPTTAKIMSISEAPGEEEDRTGRPYMGKAGKYWEGILASVGLDRKDIYVCNALHCRPPNNKLSTDLNEVVSCAPFLLKQLAIIQPDIILVFGKVAAVSLNIVNRSASLKSVLGSYSARTGNLFSYVADNQQKEAQLVVTYHPSYLMRPGKTKENLATLEHLESVRRLF